MSAPVPTRPAGLAAEFAAACVAGTLALTPVHCIDVWLHLRTGAEIVATRAIPRLDTLSHTRSGARWITHEWGFEVLLLAAWRALGDAGLVLTKATLAAAAFALVARSCRAAGASPAAAAAVAVVGAVVAAPRFMERPHMASAVLTAGFVVLGLRQLAEPGRAIWLVVPLAVAWAQLHSGIVVGLGALAVLAIEETARRRRPGPLAAATLVAALAGLANPHGWRAYAYPFELLATVHRLALDTVELRAPAFPSPVHALAAATLFAGVAAGRRAGPAVWVLAGVGAAVGLSRVRGSLDMAILAGPLLAVGLSRVTTPARVGAWAPAALAAVAIAAAAARGHRPAMGVDPLPVPREALAFVERAGLGGNLLNTEAFGPWIGWAHPERPVWVDSRVEVFADLVKETGTTPIATLADRYDLGVAVVGYANRGGGAGVVVDIADALQASPDWALVYFDDTARVYARRRPENEEAVARHGLRWLRPGWRDLDYVRAAAANADTAAAFEAEARGAIATTPEKARLARLHLAELLRLQGRLEEALSELALAGADDPFVLGRVGAIRLQAGDAPGATAALEAALAADPTVAATWSNLGQARLRGDDVTGALDAFDDALARDEDLVAARSGRVAALRRAGRAADADAEAAEIVRREDEAARRAFAAGQKLLEEGFAERAAVELRRAAALSPANANVSYLLGVACNVSGAPLEAEAALRRALALAPNHPYARLELAVALTAAGRGAEAGAELEAFLASGPEPRWAEVARRRLAALSASGEP